MVTSLPVCVQVFRCRGRRAPGVYVRADGSDRNHACQDRVAAHPQVVQARPPPRRRERLPQAMRLLLRSMKGFVGRTDRHHIAASACPPAMQLRVLRCESLNHNLRHMHACACPRRCSDWLTETQCSCLSQHAPRQAMHVCNHCRRAQCTPPCAHAYTHVSCAEARYSVRKAHRQRGRAAAQRRVHRSACGNGGPLGAPQVRWRNVEPVPATQDAPRS